MERVLLIDDERDALEVLEWVLKDCGCDVRAETDAPKALEVGRSFKPTVLVTDYFLRDDLSGLDIVRLLRKEDPGLRAVLMTGMMVEELKGEIEALGNVDVVRKPFDSTQLMSRLELSAAH
jgi:two-component system OmpR family response regulator